MRQRRLPFFIPHEGCPHRCSFCDQRAISGAQRPPTLQEITVQCEALLAASGAGADFEIAFFGGSFTAIPRGQMIAFLEAAQPFLDAGRAAGIRISTRPDAIDPEILALLARYRVRAVELGAQSMDDAVLAQNGRGHTAQQTRQAAQLLRESGFSLGLQMMIGLPGEGEPVRAARETALALAALQPDTVRIYPALVLRGTQMEGWMRQGRYRPLTVEQAVAAAAPLLALFEAEGIRVIRVGLQDDGALRQNLVAGPYHPAFRQLCEGALYRTALARALDGRSPGAYRVAVAPGRVSDAVGQQRGNLAYFAARGCRLKVVFCAALAGREIRLEEEHQRECEETTCF